LASEAGTELLRHGGNAVDAACATALALGVVSPFGSGLGGGGFALVYLAKTGQTIALDFRETAPKGLGNTAIQPQSGHSIGVPGEARGLAELVRRFGALPLSRCVDPALRMARAGFALSPWQAKKLREDLERHPDQSPGLLGKIFSIRPNSTKQLRAGQKVARPDLAKTLAKLRSEGPEALYRGPIAAAIVEAARDAGSPMTLDDLAAYAPVERTPIAVSFLGRQIMLMPPPSAGGVIVAEALGILANRLPDLRQDKDNAPVTALHVVAEALKHGFADRARFLGDPAFATLPLDHLLDPGYHRELAFRTRLDQVLKPENYGTTPPISAKPVRDAGTAHLSVIDKDGNAVALTTTINLEFGARIVAGKTGIILNDELDDFTPAGDAADVFALAGGLANAPAPGKRPLSSMTPTIVLDKSGVELVTGAAGGPRIVSAVLQILVDVLLFGNTPGQAVSRPRLHAQWSPDVLHVEPELRPEIVDALRRKGHRIEEKPDLGKANAIARKPAGLDAASDPRAGAAPAGW
jgi:gamma-glutamyltranspeptidase/glutathione hydrolase